MPCIQRKIAVTVGVLVAATYQWQGGDVLATLQLGWTASLVVAVHDMLLREIWWGLPTWRIVQPPRYHRIVNGCVVID